MSNEITIIDSKSVTKELLKNGKKFLKWTEAFLTDTSDTKGNATKSALKTYKCKNYAVASSIGHQNFRKLQNLGIMFSEIEGITIQDWFKIASSKAVKGTYEQTIAYMEKIGILDKDTNVPANQNNMQFNFGNLAEEFAKARKERGLDKIKPIEEIPDAE